MVSRSEIWGPVPEFAAEAAARRLPLKRQCSARSRARAEPRVYPRPCEAAMLCPFTGTCRAAGLPGHIDATLLVDVDEVGRGSRLKSSRGFTRAHVKRQCSARLRAGAEPRVYPRPSARRCSLMTGCGRSSCGQIRT